MKIKNLQKKILYLIAFLGGSAILGGLGILAIFGIFSLTLPELNTIADYKPSTPSKILAKDGTVLALLGKEKREVVPFEKIPKKIVNAFVAAEDKGFYEHQGVDYIGLLRATLANIKAGRVVQGGSTITQQVAKSLYLTSERSISRKIKDFLLAQKIEKKFSKEDILYLYLNQVYLGGGFYGVKEAFNGYFNKELEEATVAEAAMVAGLLVAPGRYSPYINPKQAKTRQAYVLKRMLENGKISNDEYEAAVNEKIQYRLRKASHFKAGYFTDWIRQEIINQFGEEALLNEGLTVTTTLDWDLQKVAEKEILEGAKAIDKRQGYKGPLKHLETQAKIDEYEMNFRKNLFEENSQYFTISEDLEKINEIEYDSIIHNRVKEDTFVKNELMNHKRVYPGISHGDHLLDYLRDEQTYKAVVKNVDNLSRMVYVSIGGQTGIIPYEYFRWAHERQIEESRYFWGYVTYPSRILKVGDVVEVQIKDLSTGIWGHLTTKFKNAIANDEELIRKIKKEKYILCLLDQEPDAQASLVSINPKTSEIVAFVGGTDFTKSQFNRAVQSKRQPGSSFKPLLYAAALENGFEPNSIIMDSPEALGGVDESLNWKPSNYDGKFKGPMTLRESLELSRNVPTIKIASKVGVKKIVDFVERIGLNAKLEQDLSLALGSFGVTLMDIVKTYSIFPNGGKQIYPKAITSVTSRTGESLPFKALYQEDKIEIQEKEKKELEEQKRLEEEKKQAEVATDDETADQKPKEKINPFLESLGGDQVYDSRLAYIMTNLLKGVVHHGTGRSAKSVSEYLGGKTGTTNSYVDAWFIGFSSNFVTGVWTGFDDNKTLGWGETGTKSALPIWKSFMATTISKYGEADFPIPEGIVNVLIDKKTGKIAKSRKPGTLMESFVEGSEPGAEVIQTEEKVETVQSATDEVYEDEDFYNY